MTARAVFSLVMSATTLPLRTSATRSATALRLFRKVHLYLGLFISPALLFFAITGAVQTLSLHEAAGSSYRPPAILAELGQLHKKQTMALPARKVETAGKKADGAKAVGQPAVTLAGKQRQHLPIEDLLSAGRSGPAELHGNGHLHGVPV